MVRHALLVLLLLGCEGSISEPAGHPDRTPTPRPHGPTVQPRVPLRALTSFELRGALEALGFDGESAARLQPPSVPTGIETLTEPWSGAQLELLEDAMLRAAGTGSSSCAGDLSCTHDELLAIASRAFRRDLIADERTEILELHDALAPTLGADEARVRTLQRIFLSAEFLYLTAGDASGRLTDEELAARLAFFVTGSAPDDALRAEDRLDDAALEAHARRLLDDPRAGSSLARFVVGWLGGLELSARTKLDDLWIAGLPSDAVAETRAFVSDWLAAETPRFEALFSADHTFVTPRLAELYGMPTPSEEHLVNGVARLDGSRAHGRVGLLTQTTFLARHSGSKSSSPTLRGKWMLTRLLCQNVRPPPPEANAVEPEPTPGLTTREIHERLERADGCGECHRRMEPLGYAFEAFDSVGRARTHEGEREVDTRTTVTTLSDLDGSYADATELSDAVGRSADVRACFARHWVGYALGRGAVASDESLVTEVAEALEHDAREAVVRIVTSDAFRRTTTR